MLSPIRLVTFLLFGYIAGSSAFAPPRATAPTVPLTLLHASPTDRPLLAAVDAVTLLGFAAVGKASHNPDGSLDLLAVSETALPFWLAWFATSPFTGVYSAERKEGNVVVSQVSQVAPGWLVAVPLGIALRGLIKGYVPPLSFAVVTLIATLVMLCLARILFAFAEDFFVEMVN